MTQTGGRIACPRCGANNFDTVTVCWRCQNPLHQSLQNQPVQSQAPRSAQISDRVGYSAPVVQPSQFVSTGDPSLARRASVWLALSFPYFGMPIAWAFMMTNNREYQDIGKHCMNWSIAGMVIQLIMMWLSMAAMMPMLHALLGTAVGAMHNSAGGGMSGLGGIGQ